MTRHRQCFLTLLLCLLAVSQSPAAGPFDDLLQWIPQDANTLLLMDVKELHNCPLGKLENWSKKHTRVHLGMSSLSPTITKVVVAAQLNPSTLQYTWEAGVFQLDTSIKQKDLSRLVSGSPDSVGGKSVVLSPRNAYFVQFKDWVIGMMKPANRQAVSQWVRSARPTGRVVLTPYLTEANETAGNEPRPQIVAAVEMLYGTALGTGFRASELASLLPAGFELVADPPVVRVLAACAKNRREAVQPIQPEMAETLRGYLASKPANKTVWPGTWADRAATMLRLDLEAARQTWLSNAQDSAERDRREASGFLVYRDDSGRVADFHSLRHSYITLLQQRGVSPKQAQELARHSDIRLTMNVYTHAGLYDLASAVERLPNFLSATDPTSFAPALAATGTNGAPGPRLDQTGEISCLSVTADESTGQAVTPDRQHPQTMKMKPVAIDCERLTTDETSSGGWDRTTDTRLMKSFKFQPTRGSSTKQKLHIYGPKAICLEFSRFPRLEPAAVM
jgi:hypothetical protein